MLCLGNSSSLYPELKIQEGKGWAPGEERSVGPGCHVPECYVGDLGLFLAGEMEVEERGD